MTASRRVPAMMLAWYLAIGFALPAADALLYHHGDPHAAVHVEQANSPDCHRERCSLESTKAPQALAAGAEPARAEALASRDAAPAARPAPPRDQRSQRALLPRAPPLHR